MSGWSLQAQLDKTLAKQERLIRKQIHDAIVRADEDPTLPGFLYAIDNYRPEWSDSSDIDRVFSYEAIVQWCDHHFPLDA